jgi:hypothetical protein
MVFAIAMVCIMLVLVAAMVTHAVYKVDAEQEASSIGLNVAHTSLEAPPLVLYI